MSMRAWWSVLPLVAACTFDGGGVAPSADGRGGPTDPDGGVGGGPDAAGVGAVLRHDTVDDFAAGGPRLERAQIEEWGAIGPQPLVVGALLARGLDGRLFDDADEVDWDELRRQTAGGASLMTPSPLPLVDNIPVGVGITRATQWTLWLEGEVFLEAGAHEWHLDVDDDGLVEIAPPGTAAFQRAVAADFRNEGDGTFTARAAGWHPIRIAMSQGGGDTGLALVHRGPGQVDRLPLPPWRLRATAAQTGLLAQGFDDRRLLEPRAVNLHRGAGLLFDVGTGAPRDLGIVDPETFAVRWSGQVRIDAPGRYQLRAVSDDGQRVTLDGRRVLDVWSDQRETHDVEVDLDAGWHDLVVDLRENTTDARFDLSVIAGPDLAGGRIPQARLRPTLVRTARVTGGAVAANLGISDSGTPASSKITVDTPADAVATTVDVTVTFGHASLGDLEVAVRAPDGTERVVIPMGGVRGASVAVFSAMLAGAPVDGTWEVVVRDRVANNLAGVVVEATLAVHYQGGESPVATLASYDSAVLDLGDVVGLDAVDWVARTPDKATVTVRARTCETADACANEPWSPPLTDGGRPALTPRRFLQYRAELATDGSAVPTLDAIELRYRVAE